MSHPPRNVESQIKELIMLLLYRIFSRICTSEQNRRQFYKHGVLLLFWSGVYVTGHCHEILLLQVFLWIIYPKAPENNIRVITNFFENSQVKLHHRYLRPSGKFIYCRCSLYYSKVSKHNICKTFLIEDSLHLELWISPRIFEKIRNCLHGILKGLGETEPWKILKSKIS